MIDILIDLKDKNYKIIKYLNVPTFYINVNDIYDNDLNINDTIPNYLYHPFYQQLANKEKRYRCNYCEKNDLKSLIRCLYISFK